MGASFAAEVIVLNLTPVRRENYRIGVPGAVTCLKRFSSVEKEYGGRAVLTLATAHTETVAVNGYRQSVRLLLPPLAALVLSPAS